MYMCIAGGRIVHGVEVYHQLFMHQKNDEESRDNMERFTTTTTGGFRSGSLIGGTMD